MNEKPTHFEPAYFDIERTAAYMDVSVTTVRELVREKKLIPINVGGKRVTRFARKDIDALMEASRSGGAVA